MKDLVVVVEKWAPTLASYMNGPWSGTVMHILTSAYDLELGAEKQDIADAIAGDPYRLKSIELAHLEDIWRSLSYLVAKIENKASHGVMWASGMVLLVAILGYVVFSIVGLVS